MKQADAEQFQRIFQAGTPTAAFRCPGRINLIGEHIDYLGGDVLPAAISLGQTATCRPNSTDELRIHSTSEKETTVIPLQPLPLPRKNHWSNMAVGVLHALNQRGINVGGCDMLIDSDLPQGAGLSSSAAFSVLLYFALHRQFSERPIDRKQMAFDCQCVEHDFLGVRSGIMDQFAVCFGKADHALHLNCDSLNYALVPFQSSGHELLIINTNRPRQLAESAYNQRRKECEEALDIIKKHRPIEALVNASEEDLLLLSDPVLKHRTRHAISEQQRVEKAIKALQQNDLKTFGRWMNASHFSLRDDFEVSCAELDHLVNGLQQTGDCLGARMTGAGFGGCCIAICRQANEHNWLQALQETYAARFGRDAEVYRVTVENGVSRLRMN